MIDDGFHRESFVSVVAYLLSLVSWLLSLDSCLLSPVSCLPVSCFQSHLEESASHPLPLPEGAPQVNIPNVCDVPSPER